MNAGPPRKRRPGVGNNFDRSPNPGADFLGEQSSVGNNAGLEFAMVRLVGALFNRFKRRRRPGGSGPSS